MRAFVIPVIVSILILGGLGFSQDAFADITDITNQATCEGAPVFGDFQSGTCVLDGIHTVPLDDIWVFQIPSKVTGTVNLNGILFFTASFSNSGTINAIGDPNGQNQTGFLRFILGIDYTNECNGIINLIGGTGGLSGVLVIQGVGGFPTIFNNFGTITGTNSNVQAARGIVFLSPGTDPIIFNNHGTLTAPVVAGGRFNDNLPNQCSIEADIDIKPNSDPNSVNPKSMGLVPVAILGSDTFDVADVDVTTLAFGPSGAAPVHGGHLEDVNDDGFTDLVTHYVQKETGLLSSDTEACITGQTTGGTAIEGCDSVKVK